MILERVMGKNEAQTNLIFFKLALKPRSENSKFVLLNKWNRNKKAQEFSFLRFYQFSRFF